MHGRAYPLTGDKIFFFRFPGEHTAKIIEGFPFRIIVAIPHDNGVEEKNAAKKNTIPPTTEWYTVQHVYDTLERLLATLGICYEWISAADMFTPSPEELDRYRRYRTDRKKRTPKVPPPTVVHIQALESLSHIGMTELIRLVGFVATINGKMPFFGRTRIMKLAPDTLRNYRPDMSDMEIKKMLWQLQDRGSDGRRIEEIPLESLLRNAFTNLNSHLRSYQKQGAIHDVVSDYIFNLYRAFSAEITRRKRIPVRICPICLAPLRATSAPQQVYCGGQCYGVARGLRQKKRAHSPNEFLRLFEPSRYKTK